MNSISSAGSIGYLNNISSINTQQAPTVAKSETTPDIMPQDSAEFLSSLKSDAEDGKVKLIIWYYFCIFHYLQVKDFYQQSNGFV